MNTTTTIPDNVTAEDVRAGMQAGRTFECATETHVICAGPVLVACRCSCHKIMRDAQAAGLFPVPPQEPSSR